MIIHIQVPGTEEDQVNDIVVVPFVNDVVVVGDTKSIDFPVTAGAYRTRYKYQSGFVTRINESGSGLVFSTFFGADTILTYCNAVALDRNNSPIVVGNTQPANYNVNPFGPKMFPKIHFPTSGSAIRTFNNADEATMTFDGYLIKLGAAGSTLEYGTLLGGKGTDKCLGVDVNLQGIAAVCGVTESNADFKPNPNGFDQTFGTTGTLEGFAMCIGTNGGSYYSTYLGGEDEDIPNCIKFYDNNSSVVIAGSTKSGDFPTGKVGDYQYHGGNDGFLTQLSGNGSICLYSTFVGGGSSDQIFSMALSNNGNVYIAGSTQSTDFPLSSNAKYKDFGGQVDGFISAFSTCSVSLQSPRDTLVCPGKPLTITNNATGSGTLRYNWTDFATGTSLGNQNSITVAPLEQSIYILNVTDDNCTKTVTYIVKTKPLPIINTIEEKRTCIGTSLKLSATAGPGTTIAWYDAEDASTAIAAGAIFTTPALTKSVNYFVESLDTSTKCTSLRKKIQITVVPPPPAPTADNISLCSNNSITLSAIFPSDVDFRWYDSLTNGKLIQIGRNFTTPKLTSTTTYYLESLDTTTNCISTKRTPVVVTILSTPNPLIQGQNAACVNSTGLVYTVESKPKQEYTWTINSNGSITAGQGTNKVTVTWSGLGTGILSLKQKDLTSNCFKDTSYAVNISNQLSLNLGMTGSPNLCTGDSIILDPGPGYSSYKWSSGETSQTITVKTAGDYSVDVQDAGGCKGSSNKVSITVNIKPTPLIVGKNATCVNGNPVQYSVTPIAVNSCKWEVSPEGTIVSGQDSPSIIVNWTSAGNGTVKVVESSSFCSTENVLPVVVSTSLVPTITAIGKTSLCEGESVVLDAGPFATYKWSNGETTKTITVNAAGSYTVEVADAGGCKGTSEPKIVTMSPLPTPSITSSGKTELCEGDSVELDAGTFSSFLWSNGATSQKISVKSAGKYSVTVTNASGCKGTSSEQTIIVNPLPNAISISQIGDDTLVVNPYDNANTYKWKLNGTDIGRITKEVQVNTEGNYTVEVTNQNGCKNTSIPFPYLKPNSAVLTVSVSPLIIEAVAGETVKIPLVITSSKNLTQATASSFTAEISVEPSLLVPSTGTSTIDNNRRIVSVSGSRKDGNDTLAIIEMKAALGTVETSSILVKSFTFTGGKAQVTTKDGEFRLTGVCRDGGARLYNSGSKLSLSMQPNPASETLNISITASEVGQHRVTLTNTLGEEVGVLYNGSIMGSQEISSSLADIPAGVYFVVLQSPSQMLVKRILISK
ncbi:MAG: T9SS type A sorting domain-containing protein [Ignavibacteriae bacterium]|nr:T9SS type A sorting domain-containing protein [Ignavibacteriota bacterium]